MKRLIEIFVTSIGFINYEDFVSTLFMLKNKVFYIFAVLFGTTFTTHFWNNPEQFFFLWVLLSMDLITGVASAFKLKNFSSRKLPRWGGVCFTYSVLLFLSFNLSKYSPLFFFWLPSTLYFLFCGVLFTSIIENFNKLGWLDTIIFQHIKDRIKQIISKSEKPKE